MSRESKFLKNTFILSLGTFLPKLVSFITLPILTGYLTKDEYGVYDLVLVIVSLLLPVATLQIQTAAFRFILDVRDDEEETDSIITNIYAFSAFSSFIVIVFFYFTLRQYYSFNVLLLTLYLITDIALNITMQIIRGLSLNFFYSISAITNTTVQMLLLVICVRVLNYGIDGAIFSLLCAQFVSILFLFTSTKIHKRIHLKYLDKKKIKALISYSWPMVPNSLSMWVMRVSDRLVISLFLGSSANAVYAVANKLPQILTIAQTTFSMAWQENASIVSKDDDASAYYSTMFAVLFNVMCGLMGILISLTDLMFKLLVSDEYNDSLVHVPILYMAMLFFGLSSFLGGIYIAFKKTKSIGVTTIVAATINLLVNIAFIKHIGIFAASISTLACYIFLFAYRMIDSRKFICLKFDLKHFVIVLLFLTIQCFLSAIDTAVCNIINIVFGICMFYLLNKKLMSRIWIHCFK